MHFCEFPFLFFAYYERGLHSPQLIVSDFKIIGVTCCKYILLFAFKLYLQYELLIILTLMSGLLQNSGRNKQHVNTILILKEPEIQMWK